MQYVAGFLFSEDRSKIVLIEKQKPDWQKGYLNAVGGKVELNEMPLAAMNREFREEAGMYGLLWESFCILKGSFGTVHFFRSFGNVNKVQSKEEEKVAIYDVGDIIYLKVIPNLLWLIPLALDADIENSVIHCK